MPEVEIAFLALVKVLQIVRAGREGNVGIILRNERTTFKTGFSLKTISGVSQTYLLTGDWKKASALYSGPYVVNVYNATTFTRL